MELSIQIAKDLLKIQAVFFRPDQPFTWASGIKSPVYCDNRLTLTDVEVRTDVEEGLARLIREHYPEVEVLMGTSTAGIAHAAITGHLMGLPMGMAPCYTNHTSITQDEQEMATMLLNAAGANYYIGVPVNDDIMLSYQDTSYHDNATLRELSGRLPAPEFHQWMMKRGLIDEKGVLTELAGDASIFLQ